MTERIAAAAIMETSRGTQSLMDNALSRFRHLNQTYKTVFGVHLDADILIPSSLVDGNASALPSPPTPVPLFARFHGGGLITGYSIIPDWMAAWNFTWALSHNAVVVLPNYRLMPEANGADILDDLRDFWTWVADQGKDGLLAFVQEQTGGRVALDLGRVIAMGESAGGWCSVQSGFLAEQLQHSGVELRGVIAQYPMLDMEDDWFNVAGHRADEKFIGIPVFPKSFVDDHLADVQRRRLEGGNSALVVPFAKPPDRVDLMVAAFQHGMFKQFFKGELDEVPDECYPFRRLVGLKRYPPLLMTHGTTDGAVKHEGSQRFAERLRKAVAGVEVRLETGEGDHGFDKMVGWEDGWLNDAVRWFEEKARI
jgi:acetyl esterase/lipase